nr:hypothetical protein [Tanacetum cinerariifolium]
MVNTRTDAELSRPFKTPCRHCFPRFAQRFARSSVPVLDRYNGPLYEEGRYKYSAGSLTGRALTWWNFEVRNRGREATVGMTWENFKALMKGEYYPSNKIQRLEAEFWCHFMNSILKAGMLTDKAVRNGSLKRTGERRGDETMESRVRKGMSMVTIRELRLEKCLPKLPTLLGKRHGAGPRMVNPLNARNPTAAHRACYECGGTAHYKSACPRLNRAPGQGGNRPNQAMSIEGGQGRKNNGHPTRGRAFVMEAEEARQDPNVVKGTFSLNNHYATMLFDSSADYSFVSTTFVPLLDIEPSILGFNYEIKIASGQLVEINKDYLLPKSRVCIDLIPRAMSVVKSPYHLAPTEMEELSNQLKEL